MEISASMLNKPTVKVFETLFKSNYNRFINQENFDDSSSTSNENVALGVILLILLVFFYIFYIILMIQAFRNPNHGMIWGIILLVGLFLTPVVSFIIAFVYIIFVLGTMNKGKYVANSKYHNR